MAPGHVTKLLLKTPAAQEAAPNGVQGYQDHWERLEERSRINTELLRRGEGIEGSRH